MITVADIMAEVRSGFSTQLLSEMACREWFLKRLHPNGVFCPQCGAPISNPKALERFWELHRVKCGAPGCAKGFSALTGTALNKISLDFKTLYLLLFLVDDGIPANKVAQRLGISIGAAYIWANKAKSNLGSCGKEDRGNA